jgi:hypothetical protein
LMYLLSISLFSLIKCASIAIIFEYTPGAISWNCEPHLHSSSVHRAHHDMHYHTTNPLIDSIPVQQARSYRRAASSEAKEQTNLLRVFHGITGLEQRHMNSCEGLGDPEIFSAVRRILQR